MRSKLVSGINRASREMYAKYAELGKLMVEAGDESVLSQLPEPEEVYKSLLAWTRLMQEQQEELDQREVEIKQKEIKLNDLKGSLMAAKREIWQTRTH